MSDCDEFARNLRGVQTQVGLDAILADFKANPEKYAACNGDPLQLARIRVGRNELVGLVRSINKATTETDLSNFRTSAEAALNQVEEGYVQLVGSSGGTSVGLDCDKFRESDEESKKYQGQLATEADALAKVKESLTSQSVTDVQNQVCEARALADEAKYTARWRRLAASNLCGGFDSDGMPTPYCATYGVFAAAISGVAFLDKDLHGLTGGKLVSVLVPYAGLRVIPTSRIPFLAIDITLYSAMITAGTVDTAAEPERCGDGQNALVDNLPCESGPDIQPYAAGLAGITFGKANVGYLTLAPLTLGVARVGSHGTHWYVGWLAGTLQLTGRF